MKQLRNPYLERPVLQVIGVRDGVATLKTSGSNLFLGELVFFDVGHKGVYGLTMTILSDSAIIVIFGSDVFITAKTLVYSTGRALSVQPGLHAFGRLLDGLGR